MNLSIFTVFLKNKNIIFKIRRPKVTDYAALRESVYCAYYFSYYISHMINKKFSLQRADWYTIKLPSIQPTSTYAVSW